MKKALFYLLLFLAIFPPIQTVWKERTYYLSHFDLDRAKMLYGISQYVKEKDAAWIADEILFSYAGWNYINGGNPILVNPENPPLGKYLVGISIKIFNNPSIPSLIFGFLSLFSLYLLSSTFIKEGSLALLPVAFFSWGKLFREQLTYVPLFETLALTFLVLAIYFFIKAQGKRKYFILANLFLGALWATRPWMATVPLIIAWIVYLLAQKDLKKLVYWLLATPVAVLVLLASYWRLFFEGWGIYKILSVQKWILWYHQSRLINFGSVWEFIYLAKWHVWWGDKPYLAINQWSILWPIFTTLALAFSVLVLAKGFGIKKEWFKNFKFETKVLTVCLWVIFYLVFLSFGNINSRYVFYLFPFCYILGVYLLVLIAKGLVKNRNL